MKMVFPEIRALCRNRGITFTEVDLRWGLTDEQAALGTVIRTCLEEVDKCRPYFLGMIGNRYGWVPEYHELLMDPELLAKYPWIEEAAMAGASVTEMEFLHGVFNSPKVNSDCAYFYHRDGDLSDDDYTTRLEALIERARSTGYPFRTFRTVEELGRDVRDDLLDMIDRYWPETSTPSELELERRAQASFAASRVRAYIPNVQCVKEFTTWITEGTQPLVISGESGLGKSSLVAYLADHYSKKNPTAFVIEHYIGATETSGSAAAVIRHIIGEIRERFAIEEEIPVNVEELEASFGNWLFRAEHLSEQAAVPILIVVDAVNQLDESGRRLAWMPEIIPAGIRLIVSATPGEWMDRLRAREWTELTVTPLTDERVRQSIVVRYLGEFRKSISTEQLRRVVTDAKASSPLYLRVVAEELRLHGRHRTLDETIARYTNATDMMEVFDRMLERIENDYGEADVRSMLSLIAASRFGLSEQELMECAPLARLDLSRLLFAFDYHLLHRDGRLGFFHDYLRRAVESRYLPDETRRKAAHAQLGRYFSTTDYGARRRDEEPWQWQAAGDTNALWTCFADPDMFMLFANDDHHFDFIAYLQSFERERSSELFAALHKAMEADDGFERRLWLAQIAREGASYDEASEILAEIAEQASEEQLDDKTSLDLKREQAQLYITKQEYKLALPICEEIVSMIETRVGKSEDLFSAIIDLSTVLYGIGDYAGAERVIRSALEFSEIVTPWKRIDAIQNLAAIVLLLGEQEEAITLYEQALELSKRLLGSTHPTSLFSTLNLATSMLLCAKPRDALLILEGVVHSIKNTLGDKHLWYLGCLETMGGALMDIGDYGRAELTVRELIEKSILSQGPESEMTLKSQISLGYLYHIEGELPKALEVYQTYLPRFAARLGVDHPAVKQRAKTMSNIVSALNAATEA